MKLLTLIQHTSKRPRYLDLVMTYAVGGRTDNFSIVTDDNYSACGMAKCFYKGLEDQQFTHYLILQDDILPSRDLIKVANGLIKLLPNEIVSLFSAYQVVNQAMSVNKNWATIDRLYGLCAYIIPSWMAKDYVENFVDKIKETIKADDVRLSMYLESINKRAWLTCPSLVEHIAWDHTSQNDHAVGIDNALKYRIANRYIGFENSGLDIDWKKDLEWPVQINIGQKYDHLRHYKAK